MDYFFVCLLAIFWFIRPQDVIPALAGFPFVRYIMMGSIVGTLRRPEGFDWRALFRNPIDIIFSCYLAWIIYASDDHIDTAKKVFDLAAFYWCTALALNSTERMQSYLRLWLISLVAISVFAVCAVFGLELVSGTLARTAEFKGRLALMTWLHNNPNSLGHGAVAAIPIGYAFLWRSGTSFKRFMFIIVSAVAGYCVYNTQSKGAYLAGGGTLLATMIFGRNRRVQLVILAIGLTAGLSAIKLLPRMETLDRNEGGIAGRLIIWQMARSSMENEPYGVGMKKYRALVISEMSGGRKVTESRDTHGSYVAIGAELGYGGLLFFVGIIYAGFRALFQARCGGDLQLERIRWTLFAILCSYMISAWIINKEYHTDYFLVAGAISAFHRLISRRQDESLPENIKPQYELATMGGFAPHLAMQTAGGSATAMPAWLLAIAESGRLGAVKSSPSPTESIIDPATQVQMNWRKIGWLDVFCLAAGLKLTLFLWDYLSTEFF